MSDAVAVIINPISGTGGRPEVARARAEHAAAFIAERGLEAQVLLTERPAHARELTRAVVAHGVRTVIAWGGDGTINEVASALVFGTAALGIVPSGSGNGLARELGIPFDPAAALAVALGGHERVMDAGELDGHLFFNVAGIGLDARVAHRFAAGGHLRRGLLRYLQLTASELFASVADDHTIVADGERFDERTLIVAIANSRQYGNGAIIAPAARIDDGRLDLIVVAHRSVLGTLVQVPRVFLGQIDRVPGVSVRAAEHITVSATAPVLYHVDGEPFVGAQSLTARVHPQALRVRVPTHARPDHP